METKKLIKRELLEMESIITLTVKNLDNVKKNNGYESESDTKTKDYMLGVAVAGLMEDFVRDVFKDKNEMELDSKELRDYVMKLDQEKDLKGSDDILATILINILAFEVFDEIFKGVK